MALVFEYHSLGCIIYNTKYTKYTSVNPQSKIQEQYLWEDHVKTQCKQNIADP